MKSAEVIMETDETSAPTPVTLETVLERSNLQAAWLAVKSNRGSAGVDGLSISQTHKHLKTHGTEIIHRLHQGHYRPGAVRAVKIPKANGGERQLGIPNVQDRLI